MVEKSSGEVIGCVGLQKLEGWPDVEIAWIIHRSRCHHGLASEAASAALACAWAHTDVDRIIS